MPKKALSSRHSQRAQPLGRSSGAGPRGRFFPGFPVFDLRAGFFMSPPELFQSAGRSYDDACSFATWEIRAPTSRPSDGVTNGRIAWELPVAPARLIRRDVAQLQPCGCFGRLIGWRGRANRWRESGADKRLPRSFATSPAVKAMIGIGTTLKPSRLQTLN